MENNVNNFLSNKMANMGLVCAVLIVALHSGFKGLTAIAVPYFFLAAGYFLAGHYGEVGWWKREVWKRVKSLLIPLWTWGVIGLVFTGIIQLGISIVGYQLNAEPLSWGSRVLAATGLDFMTNMGSLWFVRTLFLFVFISPFLMGGACSFRYCALSCSQAPMCLSN